MMPFYLLFREARLSADIQQRALAAALSVVPAYISRLEKGFSLPSDALLVRICQVLELDFFAAWLQVTSEKTDCAEVHQVIERLIAARQPSGFEAKYEKLSASQKKIIDNLINSFSEI